MQQPKPQQLVVVYCSQARAISNTAGIPWPVTMLLTMRGPKFILGGVIALPYKPKVAKAVADMARRIRTIHMLGLPSGNYNPSLYCPNLAWQPSSCPPRAEAALAVKKQRSRQLLSIGLPGFPVATTLRWSAVKSDKDSSFVLLTVEDRCSELRRLLDDVEHFELAAQTPADLFAVDARVLQKYQNPNVILIIHNSHYYWVGVHLSYEQWSFLQKILTGSSRGTCKHLPS